MGRPDYNYPGWPAGDTFLVYPGEDGPVSSIRWEMLKEGVEDFEVLRMASEAVERWREVDPGAAQEAARELGRAVRLAARDEDGREKDTGDIDRARAIVTRVLLDALEACK